MLQIKSFISGFILLVIVTTTSAQLMPKKPTPQQFAGYYLQQQKNWQTQQLPANSVTYKFGTVSATKTVYDFNLSKTKPVVISMPPTSTNTFQLTGKYNPAPALQTYMTQQRQQIIQWEKQSWWKDPAQAPGADFFRTMFMTNKNNWLYNSTSNLKH